ncbi:hypothetical protein TNCV_4642501 [Trichonephila clavipes]|nr:hypothetical protein TNCV_4642501 [Trichonephila clavipes]
MSVLHEHLKSMWKKGRGTSDFALTRIPILSCCDGMIVVLSLLSSQPLQVSRISTSSIFCMFNRIKARTSVGVNGDRYRAMITNFFIPELNNHDVQELWFQQDGATCHTARTTIDLLKDTFGDRLISRFGPVNWPPRS